MVIGTLQKDDNDDWIKLFIRKKHGLMGKGILIPKIVIRGQQKAHKYLLTLIVITAKLRYQIGRCRTEANTETN